MSSDSERATWKALAEGATEGPWETGRFFWKVGSTRGMADEWWVSAEAAGAVIASAPEEAPPSTPNMAFIAAARQAVPALLADVERLEAALEREVAAGDRIATENRRLREADL